MLKLLNDRSVNRIVGGAYINITLVPYMLSLIFKRQHICGAGIVNENWAVTTAHCLEQFTDQLQDLAIRSGSSYIDSGGAIHNISNFSIHENYDPTTNDYDLAVLKVNPPFVYNKQTQPLTICTNNSTINDYGLVAGWGYFLNFDPILSRRLQYVYLPKISRKKCQQDYNNQYLVTGTQVCYGFRDGGKDSCKGDSGGPMINENGCLIALTSWGDGCAKPNSPGVYTDVILLGEWIKKKVANNDNNNSTDNVSIVTGKVMEVNN